MKTVIVPDMHCPKCVARIEKALGELHLPCKVDLAGKTVEVEEARLAEALEALEDLGFTGEV